MAVSHKSLLHYRLKQPDHPHKITFQMLRKIIRSSVHKIIFYAYNTASNINYFTRKITTGRGVTGAGRVVRPARAAELKGRQNEYLK
jgi:hypothetical protein